MRARLRVAWLADGRRLHLQDGPTDLIIRAWGAPGEVARAYDAAILRMSRVLDELCEELPALRRPAPQELIGPVARRMAAAVAPFCVREFITPMAAVAGAVADEILAAMLAGSDLQRAFVNNGGDIALHLSAGAQFTAAMVDRPDRPSIVGTLSIACDCEARGIATSGWRGRSHSLGIADAVTVTAHDAAAADAAATIIANAVDVPGHPEIKRAPARGLNPQSDLGERLVTIGVGPLDAAARAMALDRGAARAEELLGLGLISGAALYVDRKSRVVRAVSANRELLDA